MDPNSKPPELKLGEVRWVSVTESDEFTHLSWALTHSSIVGLDAEWKPSGCHSSSFPTVSLLQIACRVTADSDTDSGVLVFLVDLMAIHLPSMYQLLREMFVSPDVLKLGFRFKQDLVYLSSTFCSQGCDPGFDRVEPYMDITNLYYHLQPKQMGRKSCKQSKSLSTICGEVLGVSLSKELQCSDWSLRPLTEEQKIYAASDAQCLLEMFDAFQTKVTKEGNFLDSTARLYSSNAITGLKEIFEKNDCDYVFTRKFCEASDMVKSATLSDTHQQNLAASRFISGSLCRNSIPLDVFLSNIVRKYGETILLKDADKKPRVSKKKGKRQTSTGLTCKEKFLQDYGNWHGPPPWDLLLGGDGCPKFLCDVMVEGLAKHLRCVGIDAAVPPCKKPEPRQLIDQALKEKRILLTRDAKLLKHEYLIKNQVYRVKSLLKNEQLLEVIETFQLKICEDQLMSRCTKCNGKFIQKPLTTEEAVEASKGFQIIPNCLFKQNLEFWQCIDCNQLYWEGTQYHNAVQKFMNVCKLHD